MSDKFTIIRMDHVSDVLGHNTKAWLNDGVIVYTSAGSSSCPPIVEKVEEKEDGIHLFTKDYKGSICTQDFAPIVQFIQYSDGSKIDKDLNIFLDGVLKG